MEVVELTVTFSFLFGAILLLLFSAEKSTKKNLFLKKSR